MPKDSIYTDMSEPEKSEKRIRHIFEEERRKRGLQVVLLELKLTRAIWGSPIVGENVYGEAFPFERPPRVWLEVFIPDASEWQIRRTIRHELNHITHPEKEEPYLIRIRKRNTENKKT